MCCKRDPWIYEEVNFKFRKIPISIKIQLLPRGRANLLLGSFIASHPWGVKEVKFIYTHSSDITASRDVKEFKCWFKKYATQLIRKQIALLLNLFPSRDQPLGVSFVRRGPSTQDKFVSYLNFGLFVFCKTHPSNCIYFIVFKLKGMYEWRIMRTEGRPVDSLSITRH